MALTLAIALAAAALWAPAAAQAEFGTELYDVTFVNEDGTPATQAGSHPFAMNTRLVLVHNFDPGAGSENEYSVDEDLKDLFAQQIAGLAGDSTAYPRCKTSDFLTTPPSEFLESKTLCDENATTVGAVVSGVTSNLVYSPLLNLEPPRGVPARLGWSATGVHAVLDVGVKHGGEYNITAKQTNSPTVLAITGAKVQIWGNPADPAHDVIRGRCVAGFGRNTTDTVPDIAFEHSPLAEQATCPTQNPQRPFLTLPTSCTGPAASSYAIDSWPHPGAFLAGGEPDLTDPNWATGSALTHDFSEPPRPEGFSGCAKLNFNPSITAEPTTKAATSPTGLDFSLDVDDPGLANPAGIASSDIRKAVVTLPEGMTANPSLAEGLEVCTEADLAAETLESVPGAGCPNASKIGTVEVESPLIEENVKGALYIAKPYENEFGSLLALYFVIKNRNLGIIVKQAARIEPDPLTGQLITTTDNIPQLPFSHFKLHFREGGRSPLVSPPGCGAYDGHDPAHEPVKAELFPWSGGAPVTTTSTFQIISGPDEGPCPPGGLAPFHPGFEAGSINNSAGRYSPFYMRLKRADGEQDMTKFSAVLPPGVVGKIAGVSKCPEAAIVAAKARTGAHGGQEELEHPSCPASSKIGRTLAGAGAGSQLTYVPGSLYLAGPVAGDPLSVVSITPALAGPFDAGTVVVREALTLNPVTSEVEVDGSHSDPIPHILKGIPLNVRDLRVYADKPEFTINPTNCEPSSARATLFGSFLNVFDPVDDVPVGLSSRFQAADCASLGFRPKLAIDLKGGTKRGGHPALKATVTPRPGDANFSAAVVTLPHSAFLDQAHIRTICTRVQFAAAGGNGAGCPEGSIYGHATATSPLLDDPLTGPVYLRSSSHNLPDLVVALHGLVDINLASRIDSKKGGIRSTFEGIPDAPVSKFVLEMQGAKKGLIVNSTDLCRSTNRASARLSAQNGKLYEAQPALRAKCKGARKAKRHQRRHGARAALRHLRAVR